MAQWRYIRDENLPNSCRRRVYSSTLGAWCMYYRGRQRYYGGWGVLNAVVRNSYCRSECLNFLLVVQSTACRPSQRHHIPPPPADCTAVFHTAMQPHLLGATALRCARHSNGSTALPDITIAMQYMTRHYWRSCNKFGSRILFFPCTRWYTYSKHRCHAHIPILLILLSTAVPP